MKREDETFPSPVHCQGFLGSPEVQVEPHPFLLSYPPWSYQGNTSLTITAQPTTYYSVLPFNACNTIQTSLWCCLCLFVAARSNVVIKNHKISFLLLHPLTPHPEPRPDAIPLGQLSGWLFPTPPTPSMSPHYALHLASPSALSRRALAPSITGSFNWV